jgi:uncharacterized protein YoxC
MDPSPTPSRFYIAGVIYRDGMAHHVVFQEDAVDALKGMDRRVKELEADLEILGAEIKRLNEVARGRFDEVNELKQTVHEQAKTIRGFSDKATKLQQDARTAYERGKEAGMQSSDDQHASALVVMARLVGDLTKRLEDTQGYAKGALQHAHDVLAEYDEAMGRNSTAYPGYPGSPLDKLRTLQTYLPGLIAGPHLNWKPDKPQPVKPDIASDLDRMQQGLKEMAAKGAP